MAYREDLAYIHDDGFGAHARSAAPGIIELLKTSGVTSGHVVDLGCGSGILARKLLDHDFSVTGIDLSPSMIDIALRRAPGAKYIVGSFLAVDIPPCDAVTSTGECLCYLFDERNDLSALSRLFARVHAALRPGGLFVFDVCVPGRSTEQTRSTFEGDDWAVSTEYAIDEAEMILTRTITTERRVGGDVRRDREIHRVRIYEEQQLRLRLENAGFTVRIERGYGDFAFYDGLAAFIAKKPAHQEDPSMVPSSDPSRP